MKEKTEKICVRMPNWIGDAVMALPALKALRIQYPSAKIIIATVVQCADIYRYADFLIDQLVVLDKRKTFKNSRKLRNYKFDKIIYFTNSFSTALEGFLSRIPKRIGYKTDGRGMLLTLKIDISDTSGPTHHRLYYMNLLNKALGIGINKDIPILKQAVIPPAVLTDAGWTPKKKTLGINPGAAYGSAKRWLPERFAETALHFINKKYQVIIFGGKGGEADTARDITENQKSAINLAGKTSLAELIEAISCCDIFLTNDSGPMHIASALGVPVAAIFGPTDIESTSPSGGRYEIITTHEPCAPCMKRECPLKHHNCMKNISSAMVIEALEKMERTASNAKKS